MNVTEKTFHNLNTPCCKELSLNKEDTQKMAQYTAWHISHVRYKHMWAEHILLKYKQYTNT